MQYRREEKTAGKSTFVSIHYTILMLGKINITQGTALRKSKAIGSIIGGTGGGQTQPVLCGTSPRSI
jgi:hypothetical protein